jgi:pyrroline-5-carboxylate reductase
MESIKEYKSLCKSSNYYACGFIGGGNLAAAIVKGLIKSKIFEPSEIIVSTTRAESLEKWKDLKVNTTLENKEVVRSRIVFLCVKPNGVGSVASSIEKSRKVEVDYEEETHKTSDQTLVSILAGVSTTTLKHEFKGTLVEDFNIIRAMPNTPLMVCAGATALTKDSTTTKDSQLNFLVIQEIFKNLGVVEVVDESKFHAITGLSASGPAFIYIMIEALSDAGVKQGLPRDLATKFAAQTVYGSSKTILETGMHPGQAKDQVTSAGGTTIHGIHELEKGRLRDTLINAVEAATKRSSEIASESSKK